MEYSDGERTEIGDMIELINNSGMAASEGATACVTSIASPYVTIVWISNNTNNQSNGSYHPRNFKLLSRSNDITEVCKSKDCVKTSCTKTCHNTCTCSIATLMRSGCVCGGN